MGESTLRRRSWWAILAHALFRIESALNIALAILAIGLLPRPFLWWQWWYWLILFGLAEVLIIWTSITDARTGERVVAEMLRERFDPGRLRLPHLQAEVERALQYRTGIEAGIARRREGLLRDRLLDIAGQVDQWLAQVYGLAERLDRLSSDRLVQRDLKAAPDDIARYRTRIQNEGDPEVRAHLERALASKQTQLANLQELARTMERGQLQLENTVNSLGTIYSQVVLLEAQDVDSGRMRRLSEDIEQQVASLNDVVSTLDELYRRSAEE
ncbi:MAG: hypothetical protein ACOYEW_12725 [Anaerolineae bacterium]|jgi:hypothetical protein